jgi:ribonuclease HI
MEENGRATLRFDGRCTGNGTRDARAGWGYALWIDGEEVAASSGMIDPPAHATVNTAEYAGLVVGLRAVLRGYPDVQTLDIEGDSQLVIKQLTDEWGCGTMYLKPWLREARRTLGRLEGRGCDVRLRWIPRDRNTRADALSREAFDETE